MNRFKEETEKIRERKQFVLDVVFSTLITTLCAVITLFTLYQI